MLLLGFLLCGCRTTQSVVQQPTIQSEPTFSERLVELPEPSSGATPKVELASFQEDAEESPDDADQIKTSPEDEDVVEPIPAEETEDEIEPETIAQPTFEAGLSLSDVIRAVTDCYPAIEIAIGEIESAEGKILSSSGEFDSVFSAHSISQPLGFYQTYRNGAGITRPLFGGGEVYGTYRIGDGNFEPWYGERETNEGGELKAGFSLPLLKDRNIDARRAALGSSYANRDEVLANVESRLLIFERIATQAYWDWVASGQAVQVQQQLLKLADDRITQIERRIEEGDLARIAEIDNQRLIAKRKNDLIKARRSFEKAAIKLSMFYRDASCSPVVCSETLLPGQFPTSIRIDDPQLSTDIGIAFARRPELVELAASRRAVCIDLQYANNLTIPKLDMKGFAGQDLGGETSSKGDKTPFELQVGVFAEVPLQRREGLGKIKSARGKLAQIDAKCRLTTDKIRAELQDAASAVNAAFDQIRQSTSNLELARRSLELGRQSFEAGDIDLLSLNIYESSVADAELQLLDAQFKYFYYRIVYETAKSGEGLVERGF